MKHWSAIAYLTLLTLPALSQQPPSRTQESPSACVPNKIEDYVALGSTGCTIGHYLFYDIQYSAQVDGGAFMPSVTVRPAHNNQRIRGGAILTGLSLITNWVVVSDQSVTYTLSVSIMALPPRTGIPGSLVGYGGNPFPATLVPPNQVGLSSYAYADSNGAVVDGSNLFTDLNCNSCIGEGGGAEFRFPPPQSMTLSYTQVFRAGTGGVAVEEQQFTGVEKLSN